MSRNNMYLWMLVIFALVFVTVRFTMFYTKQSNYESNESKVGDTGVTFISAKVTHQDVKHLQNLQMLNERQASLMLNRGYFYRYLSPEELSRITRCQETATAAHKSNYERFWQNKNICVLHHDYLKENDTVLIEVGGNLGKDSGAYAALYPSRHLIIEPVTYYANLLRGKFKNDFRVSVLNLGLGKKTEKVNVGITGNHCEGTNIYEKNPGNITINIINSTDFFTNIGVGIFSVDLLTMDCESCEIDVIENLLESNMIIYFKNIQFESHVRKLKGQDWIKRYCMIQEYMSRTHRLTYQYKHVWENWKRLDL